MPPQIGLCTDRKGVPYNDPRSALIARAFEKAIRVHSTTCPSPSLVAFLIAAQLSAVPVFLLPSSGARLRALRDTNGDAREN